MGELGAGPNSHDHIGGRGLNIRFSVGSTNKGIWIKVSPIQNGGIPPPAGAKFNQR